MKYKIYTDGSCRGNQFSSNVGGWSALIFENNEIVPIKTLSGCKRDTTNNKMELNACINGLFYIYKTKGTDSIDEIEVYTDSAYISNCFKEKWWIKWEQHNWKTSTKKDVKNKDLWQQLLKIYQDLQKVNFIHVKAHAGNKFNEMADQKAIEAIKNCIKER